MHTEQTFEKINLYSPPIQLSTVSTVHGDITVIREDLLPGGTKQRAIIPFLKHFADSGISEFSYASPFCGFAQIALAAGCRSLGLKSIIYCEQDPYADSELAPHTFSIKAATLGARLIVCKDLAMAEKESSKLSSSVKKIPLGFNHPVFLENYRIQIIEQYKILCQKIGGHPKRLWVSLGSGTLSSIIRSVLPSDVELHCVNIRVLENSDQRLQNVKRMKNVFWYDAGQAFHEASRITPPIPSNLFYDSKVWTNIQTHGKDRDVWWNVAR